MSMSLKSLLDNSLDEDVKETCDQHLKKNNKNTEEKNKVGERASNTKVNNVVIKSQECDKLARHSHDTKGDSVSTVNNTPCKVSNVSTKVNSLPNNLHDKSDKENNTPNRVNIHVKRDISPSFVIKNEPDFSIKDTEKSSVKFESEYVKKEQKKLLSQQSCPERSDMSKSSPRRQSSFPYMSTVSEESKNLDLSLDLKSDDYSSSWFKEQVSGSFKRLSQRISPASLDNSNDSINSDDKKLSKALSENDVSKTGWLKGYISRSKNHYYTKNNDLTNGNVDVGNDSFEISNDMASSPLSCTPPLFEEASTSTNVLNHGTGNEDDLPIMVSHFDDSARETSSLPRPMPQSKSLLVSPRQPSKSLETSKEIAASAHTTNKSQIHQRKGFLRKRDTDKKDISQALKQATPALTFSELLKSPRDLKSPELTETDGQVKSEKECTLERLRNQIILEDLKNHLQPKPSLNVSFGQLWLFTMIIFLYMISFLPSYMSGFITGCLVMFFVGCFGIWLLFPSGDVLSEYIADVEQLLERNMNKDPFEIKGLPKAEVLQKPKDKEGWLGLGFTYEDYNYQKDLTQDIYAVLHDDVLYLFFTKENIEEKTLKLRQQMPNLKKALKGKKRQAAVNTIMQQGPAFVFESKWQMNLSDCDVILKPGDLPIRRMWNKKYPIKIVIPKEKIEKQKVDLTFEDLKLSLPDILEGINVNENEINYNEEEIEFYLFGNTGREKEDWFYRLQLCVKPLKHQFSVHETITNNDPATSYPHYMIELMSESEKVMQRHEKGKKMEPYLAWLNIFLGRAFWDFWHDKYWTDKLHQKIQTRLTKINTPPFITDIKLKDLNCGHNIPIIHKGSLPVLDEYGVWTDLQITYKGCFTLTLETQLNVDYYVDLVSSIVKQKVGTDPKDHAQLSKLTKLSEISQSSTDRDVQVYTSNNVNSLALEEQKDVDETDVHMLHEEISNVYFEEEPDLESVDPVLSDPRTKAFLDSRAGKKVVGFVGWLAKSKLAKRVAETDFAKKAYEKAYEKFRKMPIILKVEIQSVRGNLAVNIPPPPTNRLWFGFRGNPVIFISASPKVGDKQVRLTYLTSWIEKKLKEEFKKYLVLPSMQDLSIKLMDSQLGTLYPERPTS